MRKPYAILSLALLSSVATAAVTWEDVLRDQKSIKAPGGVCDSACITQEWNNNNPVPVERHSTSTPTTFVAHGNETRGGASYAVCPPGTVLTGGGYQLTYFGGGSGFNAPDRSYPDTATRTWVVIGTVAADRGFKALANCLKVE